MGFSIPAEQKNDIKYILKEREKTELESRQGQKNLAHPVPKLVPFY